MVANPIVRLLVLASPFLLTTGCGGVGGLSQDDMAQYALKRPKNDETAAPAAPQKPASPAVITHVQSQPANAAASVSEDERPINKPTDVPIGPTQDTAQSAPLETSAGPLSDTESAPSTPLDTIERRRRTLDHINEVSAALEQYREKHGRYPLNAIYSQSGQPLLSWRVELLPYLGYRALYERFNKSEPWNSITNQPLLKEIPSVYQSPERFDTKTNYLVPRGSSCAFFGNRVRVPRRWEDGMANVAVLLEVDDSMAVPWSSPADLQVDLRAPKSGIGNLREDGFFMMWGGGQISRVPSTASVAHVKAMFTVDGGEPFSAGLVAKLATADFQGPAGGQTAPTNSEPATTPVMADSKTVGSLASITPNNQRAARTSESLDDLIIRTQYAFASHQEAEGVSLAYISFLSERLSCTDSYRWIPGLRRPAAFVRYGIAIDYSGTKQEEVANLIDRETGWTQKRSTFFRVAGELGEEVVERLQQTTPVAPESIMSSEPIGGQQQALALLPSNLVAPGVEFLGAGEVSEITRMAELRNVDVLLLFTVRDRPVARGNSVNKYVTLNCRDVASRRTMYESSTISYSSREKRQTTDLLYKDPIELTMTALEKLISERLDPKPIPPGLRAKHAKGRAKQLARSGRLNKLRSAAEVKLYHQLDLLSMEQTTEAYHQLIGKEAGLTLLAGDTTHREAVLAQFKPRIELADPKRHRVSDDGDD